MGYFKSGVFGDSGAVFRHTAYKWQVQSNHKTQYVQIIKGQGGITANPKPKPNLNPSLR